MINTRPPETWTVLDTHFGSGLGLQRTLRQREVGGQTGLLHYVGICATPSGCRPDIPAQEPYDPIHAELGQALTAVTPGFQRILLAGGRIRLTLCVGPLQSMLAEQSFQADEIFASPEPGLWDKWVTQLLTRRCRRGTVLRVCNPSEAEAPGFDFSGSLTALGFRWQSPAVAMYNPSWELRATRARRPTPCTPIGRCAVVGAGLAGAAVAHSMVQRGWQVTVLDSHTHPAGGASGLPVGLVVPHVSVDDSPRSRLSRVGASLMLQHAQSLLRKGEDWEASGALEVGRDAQWCLQSCAPLQAAGWIAPGELQSTQAPWARGVDCNHSLWHGRAAWIKPAKLVQAWLSAPGIQWLGGHQVQRLEHAAGVWSLYGTNSGCLAQAEVVVLANAAGAIELLNDLQVPLPDALMRQLGMVQKLHGTVSHGSIARSHRAQLPPFPVNGGGSLVTVSDGDVEHWFTGASYESHVSALQDVPGQHAHNLDRLHRLLPAAGRALAEAFHSGAAQAWTGTRCVSHDRLPWAGPVDVDGRSGLWVSAAMGSRGLSFAALCAELVAAQLGGEPFPIEARLARCLSPERAAHRKTNAVHR
ncbi:MAG: FAD-dependent cmnm(5)s(2)U34 oxidoreductase [Burkholderiales bacterium PBB4]|nr:MAG: FAD-dependent cmnm(5)s(2)U34 oxidoreductase [Burkholderiales bacterium PBB4]